MASKVFLGVTIKPADEKRMVGDIRNFYGAGLVFTSYSTAKNSVTWPHRDAQEMENQFLAKAACLRGARISGGHPALSATKPPFCGRFPALSKSESRKCNADNLHRHFND